MEIRIELNLSQSKVFSLLNHFDDSSYIPFHEGLDLISYSFKLSNYAHFIIAEENKSLAGFIAFYLNEEGHYVYVPQVVVHRVFRHRGVGHLMFSFLLENLSSNYDKVRLEVLKSNVNARKFYIREGFFELEDRGERLLFQKNLEQKHFVCIH